MVEIEQISSNGHALLAEMVIHYLETQRQYVKGAQELEAFWDVEEVGADVPGVSGSVYDVVDDSYRLTSETFIPPLDAPCRRLFSRKRYSTI